ncbi:protein related to Mitochondrial chaperone [Pyrrhoderma noxium]|uniref:Protein related to Mitochondrial chaperone n=1 Tax=Pyrrhoderma noxium TaxID=2282107 RepID=A0A286UAA4_9AGAM|nr:protein related to Mitochondrial chaperone [Pyrrhoderma noxium]
MSSTQTSAIPPNTIQEQEEKGLSMATPFLVGIGAIGAALAGRHLLRAGASRGAKEFVKGGFKTKMDRKEAIEILGLKDTPQLKLKLKDAHRQIMLANHPDRGVGRKGQITTSFLSIYC